MGPYTGPLNENTLNGAVDAKIIGKNIIMKKLSSIGLTPLDILLILYIRELLSNHGGSGHAVLCCPCQ